VVVRPRSIYAVVLNMMQQLGALFTPNGRNVVGLDVRNVHYTVRGRDWWSGAPARRWLTQNAYGSVPCALTVSAGL